MTDCSSEAAERTCSRQRPGATVTSDGGIPGNVPGRNKEALLWTLWKGLLTKGRAGARDPTRMVRHLGLAAALQLKGGEGTVFLQAGESWECGGGPWPRVTAMEGAGGNTPNSSCPWLPSLGESSLATRKEEARNLQEPASQSTPQARESASEDS